VEEEVGRDFSRGPGGAGPSSPKNAGLRFAPACGMSPARPARPAKPARPSRKDARASLGKRGEDLACEELQRRGYAILDRRFRTRSGELDIVAKDGRVLVFVEVKARSGSSFGSPFESVTWQKRHRLCRMAAAYLWQKRLPDSACRFDIVGVTVGPDGGFQIEIIQSAFDLNA
jgi:putative endonuclease